MSENESAKQDRLPQTAPETKPDTKTKMSHRVGPAPGGQEGRSGTGAGAETTPHPESLPSVTLGGLLRGWLT